MADKTIGDLTEALQINDNDLFVLQQNSEAKKLKGARLVKYARDTVGAQVTVATEAAESAETAKTGAESAQTQAQAARDAILNMLVEAITLEQGSPATVEKSLVGSVYKLTFGLPSGKKGDKGDKGDPGSYTAGTGIEITNGVISATAEVYKAGNGISIGNGLISALLGTGLKFDTEKKITLNESVFVEYTDDEITNFYNAG